MVVNIEELKHVIEEATVGLYDKDELLNLIQEAAKKLEKGDIMEKIRNVDVNRLHDFKNHP